MPKALARGIFKIIYANLCGIDVSPTMISNVTNKLIPLIKEWQNRPLHSVYAVVFMDAIHYKVKQDGAIINKAAYMVIELTSMEIKMYSACGLESTNPLSSG
jgi:transposase-like protein